MNDRALARLLRDAGELLDRCEPVLLERLSDITDAMNGWPRGGGGLSSVATSDTTGNAAIRPDRARSDRAKLEAALVSIGRQAEDLVNLLARYTPRPASDRERSETVAVNERVDGCSSCARLEVAKGVKRWEPAARSVRMDDGSERPLCEWCRAWLRQVGAMPSAQELELHHRGVRVRRPA